MTAIYLLCIHTNDIDAFCHLDHMKRYALNSCEMLIDALNDNFPNPNPHNERLKREILEIRNSTVNYYDESRHVLPIHLRMKIDGSFPAGGYIVLDHLYAKILRRYYPSIYHVIPKTLYQRHEDDVNRRHHPSSDDNEMSNDIPYRRRKRDGHHAMDEKKDKKTINFTYCCLNKCKPYDLCEL